MDVSKFFPPMRNALGEGNKAIFEDVYPVAAYRARHGYEDLKKCYAATGEPLNENLRKAMDELENNRSRRSADIIGRYEQKDIIQKVYEKYSKTFALGEFVGSSDAWQYVTGKKANEIPVSYECGAPNAVPFPGSISDSDDRVDYYNLLMDRLETQEGW